MMTMLIRVLCVQDPAGLLAPIPDTAGEGPLSGSAHGICSHAAGNLGSRMSDSVSYVGR